MTREYKLTFKLPCGKGFSFNISVCEDDYDPTTEVGNYPSRHLVDYYLLYVPQLQDYSGNEISNGIVMSVYQKNDGDKKGPAINDKTENEPKHETETASSFKSLYWKNGNIVKTRANGYGIISNDVIFCECTSFYKSDLDESLLSVTQTINMLGNEIIEVWHNSSTIPFNPYNSEEVYKCCKRIWVRPIEMTREEIEQKLNLQKGSLVIKD